MNKRLASCTAAALLCGLGFAGQAIGGKTTIEFTIHSNTSHNFQYSVLHSAAGSQNNTGLPFAHFNGKFRVEYDDVANTMTFKSFTGNIFNPNIQDADGVDIQLSEQTTMNLSNGSGSDLVSGQLKLNIFDGDEHENLVFNFAATSWNALANKFFDVNSGQTLPNGAPQVAGAQFGIGLWGAASNSNQTFFDGKAYAGGNDTYDVGIDIWATGVIVPLPHPAALASVGLCGMVVLRRRR